MRNAMFILILCLVGGLSAVLPFAEPVSAQEVVLQSTGQLVSVGKETIKVVMDSDGVEKTYTLTADTEFIDSDGKSVAVDSFRPGDRLTITTALESTVALTVKKGLITISF